MTPATRNRQIALGMLVELYYPASGGYEFTGASADEIAGNIDKLASLGRTARWLKAIAGWSAQVREHGAEGDQAMRWAFLQFAVYAGHASE